MFCRKYRKKVNETNKCLECDSQFKSVFDKFSKKHDGALKNLAQR